MSRNAPKLGRPPAGEIEQRKRTILAKATELFIANGFEKTTVGAIGKAAGVTKRTIYDHIGDKDTLFRAVCMEQLPQTLQAQFELELEGKSTRQALKDMAGLLVDYSLSAETIALTQMLMVERMRFPDLLREAATEMRELYSDLIRTAFDEMAGMGLLPPSDNERIAHYFYDIVIGGNQLQMLFDVKSEPPGDAEIDERVNIFLYSYLDQGSFRKRD